MKKTKKFKVVALLLCAMSVFTVVLAEPGGADDPLVSKSYIDTVLIPQIKQYVEEKISGINITDNGEAGVSQTTQTFEVVALSKGQNLMCQAGAELILRDGCAAARGPCP